MVIRPLYYLKSVSIKEILGVNLAPLRYRKLGVEQTSPWTGHTVVVQRLETVPGQVGSTPKFLYDFDVNFHSSIFIKTIKNVRTLDETVPFSYSNTACFLILIGYVLSFL